MRTEKEYMCDRIREYVEKYRESFNRIDDFMVDNCIIFLEEASLKSLEIIFRIETFMDVEKQVENKVMADFEEVPEVEIKIRKRKDVNIVRAGDWVWLPHGAHFIGVENCLFRMATIVGDFIISTVGQYFYKEEMKEIGCDRFYETMVFVAGESNGECFCCPKSIDLDNKYGPEGLETIGYNNSEFAFDGHMEICGKYSMLEVVK